MAADPNCAIYAALGAELARACDGVDQLAGLVCDYVRGASAAGRPDIVRQAQAADALRQNLQALSDLTIALSHGEPIETAVTAIPLADLARRLGEALLAVGPAGAAEAESGGFTVFG
jgi:hypothetical protein